MNEDYCNISTLEELRHAQCNCRRKLKRVISGLENSGNNLIGSLSPARMFSSAVSNVFAFISDAALVRKGYKIAVSLLEKLFPDERKNADGDARPAE